MTQISEEIKRKIEDYIEESYVGMKDSDNVPIEFTIGSLKAETESDILYGVSLMQEEIDRLRNSGVKHILEQANEIEVLKDTIESQAKEIESLKNDLVDALDLKDGHGPTALTMMAKEIEKLRTALFNVRPFIHDDYKEIRTSIDTLLTPKP